jgi:acyl CoA:acetate/3-ketoacid CoA transferase beta subunit
MTKGEHGVAEKPRLSRDLMAARVASEFQDGWIVNLGIGMPTLCSDFVPADRRVIFHSENGVVGYGRNVSGDEVDPHLVNALPYLREGVQVVLCCCIRSRRSCITPTPSR